LSNWFKCASTWVGEHAGHPVTFLLAAALVVTWAGFGPFVGYSERWQLVINTSTTIITFLMVFLIQATQNRDTKAMQAKLDELVRAADKASNAVVGLERR
jgi:low affinity Fe/Cu permease